MKASEEKWPTIFKIVNVSTSILGDLFNLYFVTAVTNNNQAISIKKVIPILSETEIEADKVVLSTLLHKEQLKTLYETFGAALQGMAWAVLRFIKGDCGCSGRVICKEFWASQGFFSLPLRFTQGGLRCARQNDRGKMRNSFSSFSHSWTAPWLPFPTREGAGG